MLGSHHQQDYFQCIQISKKIVLCFPFLPGQSPRPPRMVELTLIPSPSSPRNSPRQTTYHSDNQSHLHHQSKLFLHSANLKVEVLQYPFLVRVYNSNRPVNLIDLKKGDILSMTVLLDQLPEFIPNLPIGFLNLL